MVPIQYADRQHTSWKYCFSLDVAKFVFALLVIIIHTRPFSGLSDIIDFYLVDVIARIAVPLFFAISGYLFFNGLRYQDGKISKCAENRAKLFKYLKRIVLLYFGWSIVYILVQLPHWYQTGWWGKALLKDCAASFLFSGSYYHLWYLLALIYALPLLYLLLSVVSTQHLRTIIPLLWLVECLLYSYDWIGIDRISVLSWLTGHFSVIFDAVFRAVPLLGIGILCMKSNAKQPKKSYICVALSILACAAEASILHFCTANSSRYSYLLFTPIMTYFLLQMLFSITKCGSLRIGTLCRKSSLVIYCLHPLILRLLEFIGVESRMLLWILVTLITVFLALFWVSFTERIQKRKRAH